MGYQLSVDLGTTYTAAAIARDGRVEVAPLGTSGPVIPSVVLLRSDGEVLVGEAAVRRGLEEPTRLAREFKRRLGDPTPLVLGGTPYGAEALMAHLLRWVVKTVSDREGLLPDRVVLTHPANFGPYKLDMMREVARVAGLQLDTTLFLTEPQGAALSYASRNRVEPGAVIAVYDFGGGTFDVAILQRSDDGFSLLGRPEGMERFGGIDIDSAILAHVDQQMNGAIRALDPDDPPVITAIARLKDECRIAKETLAVDTDTSIEVLLPGSAATRIRLTRRELESMVRPRLDETIETLQRAVRSAGLTMEQVSRVLLVGGSSRMPLVAETLQRQTGRPVAVDAHPKFAIALGAVAFAGEATAAPTVVIPPVVPAVALLAATSAFVEAPVSAPTSELNGRFHTPAALTEKPSKRNPKVLIGAGVAAAALMGAVIALSGGNEKKPTASAPATSPSLSSPPTASDLGSAKGQTTTPVESPVQTVARTVTTVTPIEVPTVADFPLAASRSTQFAEVTYTVTKVQITNGEVDSVHHPAFDEPAVAVGNTVVRVSVTLQNLATDYNDPEKTASLRLAGDPLEITSEFAKGASRLTGGSGARLDYDFVLPEGTKVDPAILSGAQFLLSHKDRRGAGIPLDGTAPSALVTQPLAVGAIGITTRLAPGEIHVDSITPVLDGLLARGDARYFRAGTDEVFFKMDLTLRCIDANSSGCYFGLLDDSVRVDVDGLVTSMRSIYNLGMLDIDAAHMPNGASAAITTYMRVPVGKVYTLLLGDPKTPTAVNSVPLDIATQVDALVASVAEYQLS